MSELITRLAMESGAISGKMVMGVSDQMSAVAKSSLTRSVWNKVILGAIKHVWVLLGTGRNTTVFPLSDDDMLEDVISHNESILETIDSTKQLIVPNS